ncbi:MAG TPA: M1 family metallopeptidase [Candidatus Acidoferrales bacterium]|nr:M1 family metallopeptidase [Candidatus Acidoferrales bacterium]
MSIQASADKFPRQPGIKILHYGFDVTLSNASDEVVVKDTIDLQFLASGVHSINLNLCNLIRQPQPENRLNPCQIPPPRRRRGASPSPVAPAPSSLGRGMTVTGVASGDGSALAFTHENNMVRVNFPKESKAGERFSFTVSYHGIPAAGLYIGKNKYGDRVWFTDNWPNKARNWLATIDHISVKAPKTISVTAPDTYQVISNGKMIEETNLPGSLLQTVWQESMPIPSWQYSLGVAAMAVAHFGQFHGTQFSVWVFPQDRDSSFRALEPNTQSIFEFYTDHIGPFAYEKLAQVEAAGGGGATEPATTIFYYGTYGAQAHEMAHHWFGDAVTESDWDDVWLSEGFATYFNLLYIEHQYGRDAFIAGIKRTREAALQYELAHPDDTVVHKNLATASNVFSNSTQIYQGGAMVLQMLRGVLGDANFWAGIRLYYSRFRNGSASSDDFRHAMEDACYAAGNCHDRDLSWFVHEWLNRGGFMHVAGGWHYDPQAQQLQITLDQTGNQELYRMPIGIGISLPPGAPAPVPSAAGRMANAGPRGSGQTEPTTQIVTILVDKRHNTLSVPLAVAPTNVELDPNLWVPMMEATFEKQ